MQEWLAGHELKNRPYEIQQKIGQGGFGITYQAKNLNLDVPVVIKTPNSKLQRNHDSSKHLNNFIKEAKQLAKLGMNPHLHIVRVFDFFEEDNLPCIVMDYIPGNSLYDLVQMNGALPEERALEYIRQVGSALEVCHQRGIIHRDAHPNNILIHADSGKAVLIDFGISGSTQTSRSNRLGNPAFAPWEQLISFGEQSSKTPQVDIYTLAGSFYYLVTGDTPTPSLARKYNNDELIEPKQHNSQLSHHINKAILKGMEIEPGNRSQSVGEWLELLNQTRNYPPPPTEKELTLKVFEFETVKIKQMRVRKKNPEVSLIREKNQTTYFVEDLGNGITLEMLEIPGGTFMMGSPADKREIFRRATPQHKVTVPSFYMAKFEVTQAQWKQSATMPQIKNELKPDPSSFKGDNLPVEKVNWYDAVEFCARLSKVTGREYRLPSEAEWEYACRAGTTTPFHFGEMIVTDLANYRGTDYKYEGEVYPGNYANGPKGEFRDKTTPVGSFPPNAFGLYDMHGLVWEWCADTYHESYEGAPSDGSAWVTNSNSNYILRGGAWNVTPLICHSACRYNDAPVNDSNFIGFRCVTNRIW